MKNYKSLEAHNFFLSGWVHTVVHMKIDQSDNILLKAHVRPSKGANYQPHHPCVTLSTEVTVLVGHCDCMAG